MLGENIRKWGFWSLDFFRKNGIRKNYNDIDKMLNDEEYYQKQSIKYLKVLLDRACNETEFYSEYKDIYDLNGFPVINKNLIRKNQKEFLSNKYNEDELHKRFTSGSTGTPFKAY